MGELSTCGQELHLAPTESLELLGLLFVRLWLILCLGCFLTYVPKQGFTYEVEIFCHHRFLQSNPMSAFSISSQITQNRTKNRTQIKCLTVSFLKLHCKNSCPWFWAYNVLLGSHWALSGLHRGSQVPFCPTLFLGAHKL